MPSASQWQTLFAAAQAARLHAHAPYSRFQVGAAVLCEDGSTVSGCNVENASYGLTLCAERNALAAAVAQGKRAVALALVTGATAPTPPCGACRQVLAELLPPTAPVRSRTLSGKDSRTTVRRLLPGAFDRSQLPRRR